MASFITAGNATNGLQVSSDNTGILELKSGTGSGTTAISISTSQVVTGTVGNVMLISGTAKTAVTDFTTTADFTGIPSWVKRITMVFDGISLSGSDNMLVQIGDSGGLETTGYVSVGANSRDGLTTVGATSTTGFIVYNGSNATNYFYGSIRIENTSGNTWVASVVGTLGTSGGVPSTANSTAGGGSKTLSATLDRITLTRAGTNTFDAGTVNIFYE